jgi:WD40 repeat protein
MGETPSGSDLFNDLAHEFAERYRRGERPSPSEYVERYPDLAGEIRDLFPALVMMERLGGDEPTRVTAAGRPAPIPVPDRLGDYRILREIGRGGMGIVYEAIQESLGRRVALKVLAPDRFAGGVAMIRFRREARTAALLHHTNIVPVFGVGEHEGVPYFAMQYIQGRSLDVVLREVAGLRRDTPSRAGPGGGTGVVTRRFSPPAGESEAEADGPAPLSTADASTAGADAPAAGRAGTDPPAPGQARRPSFRDAARMIAQAADALAHAHAHGVVHRDVKPANLLLDDDGTLWVSDFGLAKAEDSEGLTRPGDVVGTLRYLAPERFAGRTDARSDIYSLGMTLYELLALEPAFRASDRASLMRAILHEEPRRPRAVDRRIPRDLETIVLKAIAKDPAHRFAGAGEMAAELSRFVEGLPICSRRPSVAERVWRWSRRNPAPALLGLLASVLAAALVIGSVAAAWTFREQRDAVSSQQVKTAANLARALAAERRSEAELGRWKRLRARDLRLSGGSVHRAEGLRILVEAAEIASKVGAPPEDLAELRDEAIATLALDDTPRVETRPAPDLVSPRASGAFEADRYIVLGDDGSIHVHRLSDRSELKVVKAGRPANRDWPLLSPGGRFLGTRAGPSRVELWDLERGEIPAAWPADARGLAHRADGRQVAALRVDGELIVFDLPAMTVAARARIESEVHVLLSHHWMALSGDGRRAAVLLKNNEGIAVYDLASGRRVADLKIPIPQIYASLAINREGSLVAFAHDRAITVFDVAGSEVIARLQGHQGEGLTTSFQPRGGLLVSSGWEETTRLWDPIQGKPVAILAGKRAAWADGGSRLATVVNREEFVIYGAAVADQRRTIDCRTLGDRPGRALHGPARVEYSPDGRLIAMAMRPDGVRIVRASHGAPLARLPIGDCDEAAFLPDGDLLTYNYRGLSRWPIRRLPDGALRLGPPRPLAGVDGPSDSVLSGLAASASGRLVGVASPRSPGALILDPDQWRRRTWLIPHATIRDVAISPDDRWVATAGWGMEPDSRRVYIWDAADGKKLLTLEAGLARVAFSPDGRWLGVGGMYRYRFHKAGSWEPAAEVEHGVQGGTMPMAFHPGSRVAAVLVDESRASARLVEVETGRVLANLEPPDAAQTLCLAFSPDGRYLAAGQSDHRVHVWDLARVRHRLGDLGLAAGLPDVFGGAAVPAGSAEAPSVDRIEVVGADPAGLRWLEIQQILRGAWVAFLRILDPGLNNSEELRFRAERWIRLGQWRLAAADCRAALARRPDSSRAAYLLARCLVNDPGIGDPGEAVRRARTAVALRPEYGESHVTLGAALYQAGSFAEAVAELEAHIPRAPSGAGVGWLYLAMCRHRLGQAAAARAALTEAIRWRTTTRAILPADADVFRDRLREAESVLAGAPPDLPADVFAR